MCIRDRCADDHLICKECRPRVARCPQCRETFPRGEPTRFRGAERQAARLAALYKDRISLGDDDGHVEIQI